MPNTYFDIERFVRAQDGGAYGQALAEIRAGRKRSHWIWFVFPQVRGLGHSPMRSATASPAAQSLTRTSTIPCSGHDFSKSRTHFSPCREATPWLFWGASTPSRSARR